VPDVWVPSRLTRSVAEGRGLVGEGPPGQVRLQVGGFPDGRAQTIALRLAIEAADEQGSVDLWRDERRLELGSTRGDPAPPRAPHSL
jgi:hypothetical protein